MQGILQNTLLVSTNANCDLQENIKLLRLNYLVSPVYFLLQRFMVPSKNHNFDLLISDLHVNPSLSISTKELFCPIPNCSRSDSNSTKKPFKTFKLLKQHFLIKHQQKSFKCDQCTSHFHDSVALKSHVQVCGKLVCQTCSKSYRATDGLEKHLRAHKGGFSN